MLRPFIFWKKTWQPCTVLSSSTETSHGIKSSSKQSTCWSQPGLLSASSSSFRQQPRRKRGLNLWRWTISAFASSSSRFAGRWASSCLLVSWSQRGLEMRSNDEKDDNKIVDSFRFSSEICHTQSHYLCIATSVSINLSYFSCTSIACLIGLNFRLSSPTMFNQIKLIGIC